MSETLGPATGVLSAEIASVLPRFFEGGKGPSHDELTLLFRQAGLADADPGLSGPAGPIGKMKRVRRVLLHAVSSAPEAGGRLVVQLVDTVRASGAFVPEASEYVGDEVMGAARRGFAALGYEFDAEGHLRPALLENLDGAELTEALWTYVRRARSGASDQPQVVGTAKDLAEAVARHVLVESGGEYAPGMGFPGTLYHAYLQLGMAAPDPKLLGQLDADPRLAMQQAIYLLACATNRLRNAEGAGHGRPAPSTADALDGRLSAQASGLVSDLLLTLLEREQG